MNGKIERVAQVVCQDCPFSKVVHPADRELPANIVVKHGRKTGHTSRVKYPDDESIPTAAD